jgi:cytochrome P450
MASITRDIISSWQPGQILSLHPYTQEITLQVILRTVFGAEDGPELDLLNKRMKRLLSDAEYRVAFMVLIYLANRPELESRVPWRFLLRARNLTDELLYEIIRTRRADPNAKNRKDVLAALMLATDERGELLSDRELRDELMTAIAAGHETTATALAWSFERILAHPKVYATLREEVAGAGGVNATPEKIAALPYLDATIKEVMRMRPIIPLVGRTLKKPTTLGGYDLPVGTKVAACIYLAQRNPDVYPNPERFHPERFVGVPVDPVHWLPFGGGIRRCIGAHFALYEMKIVLSTMLAHTELELAQDTPVRTLRRAVTFFPEHGTRVRVLRVRGNRQPPKAVAQAPKLEHRLRTAFGLGR